jgi:hypothetical protein
MTFDEWRKEQQAQHETKRHEALAELVDSIHAAALLSTRSIRRGTWIAVNVVRWHQRAAKVGRGRLVQAAKP